MKKSLAIFSLTNRILVNQIKKAINTGTKKFILAAVTISFLTIAILCGYWLSNDILNLFLSGDSKSIYMLLISESIVISVITFAIYVLLQFIVPDDGNLNTILRWMPIKPIERQFSRSLPTIVNIISSLSLIMIVLFLPPMFAQRISLDIIFLFVLCLFLQIVTTTIILISIHNILSFAALKLRIPFARNISITSIILIVSIFLIQFLGVFTNFLENSDYFSYNPLVMSTSIYLAFHNETLDIAINWLLLSVVFVVLIFIFVLSLLLESTVKEKNALTIFKVIEFPNSKFFSLVCKEFKLLIRNEENILFILLLFILSCFLRLKFDYTIAQNNSSIYIALLSSFPALSSFGMDLKKIPLYKQMGINSIKFSFSKLLGCLFISTFVFIVTHLIMISLNVQISNIFIGLGVLLSAVIVLNFAGVLIPIDKENSYVQGYAIMMIILVGFPLYYGINYLSNYSGAISLIVALVINIILVLGSTQIVALRWRK